MLNTTLENKLFKMFEESLQKFYTKEIDNILNGVNERNLCARLSIYIENLLEKYNLSDYISDADYNRKQDGQIKTILDNKMEVVKIICDIIIHSRGKNILHDNLIAIEMKKSTRSEKDKMDDRNRLRALTKDSFNDSWSNDGITHPEHVCGYKLGFYIELDIDNRISIYELYRKGNKIHSWKENF